jgi:hypothetical protein
MQYIVKNIKPNERLPEILLNGSKILCINFAGVRIIDSINFMPMALSKLPKTFNLQELKKGYFPHFFNTPENQNYIGTFPNISFYGAEYMSKDENAKFMNWYTSKAHEQFDFQKELVAYCASDVDILFKACVEFRRIFMELTDEDPFSKCLTMPSACHLVYRKHFMPSQSIALIPEFGYQKIEPSSYKSYNWLKFISLRDNIYIQHARNGGEKLFDKFKVDGYCEQNSTIYEFHGCLYHGCPKCYTERTFNTVLHETMGQTYQKHVSRITLLKTYRPVVEIWECDYNHLLKDDVFFAQFVKSQRENRPPLAPRNALTGGRTNALSLYYKGKAGYIDFTSLYPYVQKYGIFPIGHPIIITENFQDMSNYFGLVYCRVLPPQNLFIPVLPYHSNGKLMFPLCAACADLKQEKCKHLPHERELEGTWVSLELNEALKRGYTLTHVYEVWHFETTSQYDKSTKSGGLFTEYVNTFLKIKQQASGYPDWVKSEGDKNKYINQYLDREGIQLEKDKINVNSGLKALSKLLLNSQWGRYAMNTNRTQTKFITNPADLYKYFLDKQYIVKDVLFPTDDVAMLFYEDDKEMHTSSNQTNVVLASFVTSQARLKLFYELEKLGERVLYLDTDSIIYKKIEGKYEPEIGDFLGEFTNEVEEGREIVEFVSAGPKNYAYLLDNGISHCKVKGFSLNYTASKLVDFNKIKHIVTKDFTGSETIEENLITRNKKDWSLHTRKQAKIYRVVYDKRVILPDLSTIPYGYKF